MARWLKNYGIDFVVLEKSSDIGGLWRYREDDYGVMEFTHINVSKHNYCYSDHQFDHNAPDFPHHSKMFDYIKSYAHKFELMKHVLLNNSLLSIEELEDKHGIDEDRLKFKRIQNYDRLWKVRVKDTELNEDFVYITPYLSVATGHHATPNYADFPGLSSFTGSVIHSVKFKSAGFNKMCGKRVLIVGIGNSAVDVATNLASDGKCPKVTISTRSGAWIIPNYTSGFPIDLYSCRAMLAIPWQITTRILESKIKMIYGHPNKYNLNPTMRAMQTQPTISPTLINHIQRQHINIMPNIKSIDGRVVTFDNDESDDYDHIVLCTGYKTNLEFLSPSLRAQVFGDTNETELNLFKQAFSPSIGRSLGFIGFIQASSGGVLPVSEMQARWHVQLMIGGAKLPSEREMNEEIQNDNRINTARYYSSKRHQLQIDPITYNDQIGRYFNAAPTFGGNLNVLWRLFFSSCGPAQYRLNGPDADPQAIEVIRNVPVTDMMKLLAFASLAVVVFFLFQVFRHPVVFGFCGLSYVLHRKFLKKD